MSPRLGSREDIALQPEVEATMKLNSRDLKNIAVLTLQHYNEHAEDFLRGTRDHDVSQNIAALLQYIDCKRPSTILDFGCGPRSQTGSGGWESPPPTGSGSRLGEPSHT